MAFTSADLLNSIARRSYAPTGQLTLTSAEILAIADEVTAMDLVPDIVSVREEFFVVYKDYSITQSVATYPIHARSIGMSLREVWLVDGDSVTPNFPRVEPETIKSLGSGSPEGFFLQNNAIVLVPVPSSTSKSIRQHFPLHPGKLVETSDAAVISSINTGTNTVVVSSIPSAWATGNSFDLIKQDGGQEPLSIDLTSTNVSGTSITLPSLPTDLRVGDYVALAGETPLPFLPLVYRYVLAQGVAAEILEGMNQPGADKARKRYDSMREKAPKLLTPRVQGEDRAILPSNWF